MVTKRDISSRHRASQSPPEKAILLIFTPTHPSSRCESPFITYVEELLAGRIQGSAPPLVGEFSSSQLPDDSDVVVLSPLRQRGIEGLMDINEDHPPSLIATDEDSTPSKPEATASFQRIEINCSRLKTLSEWAIARLSPKEAALRKGLAEGQKGEDLAEGEIAKIADELQEIHRELENARAIRGACEAIISSEHAITTVASICHFVEEFMVSVEFPGAELMLCDDAGRCVDALRILEYQIQGNRNLACITLRQTLEIFISESAGSESRTIHSAEYQAKLAKAIDDLKQELYTWERQTVNGVEKSMDEATENRAELEIAIKTLRELGVTNEETVRYLEEQHSTTLRRIASLEAAHRQLLRALKLLEKLKETNFAFLDPEFQILPELLARELEILPIDARCEAWKVSCKLGLQYGLLGFQRFLENEDYTIENLRSFVDSEKSWIHRFCEQNPCFMCKESSA